MKIVHICMSQYSDGWTYQENLLTKYHKILGYDVEVITSMFCYKEGKLVEDTRTDFIDINGVKVNRLKKKSSGLLGKVLLYEHFYETLETIRADIIFSHGCQYKDTVNVIKYIKKYPKTKLFVDNHADFTNSATNFFSFNILHKIIWRHYAQILVPYTEKFWGVLPARVDFLTNVYGIPKTKCDLLVMGADDELVEMAGTEEKIKSLRNKYKISENDFLIVTGGKIDKAKIQTVNLMEVVSKIKEDNIKLMVFGAIDAEIKDQVMQWVDGNKVMYVGWVTPEQSYQYFAAADLVVFPGRHSVFWEQVVGQGIPMIVKDWTGTHHVDVGGNVQFLKCSNTDEIRTLILKIYNNKEQYSDMKDVAQNKGKEVFSYKKISQRSISLDKSVIEE